MNAGLFVWPVRVYYEDTDASGVVYHANYLRYFERARTEWLRSLGLGHEVLMQQYGVAFTVSHMDIAFLRPARLDDELEATVLIAERKRASLRFAQTLRRRDDPSRVLATANVRAGCVAVASFRPVALPPAIAASFGAAPTQTA